MAGIAGAQIAALGQQPPIGGSTKAASDGTTSCRGCLTNLIGFGLDLSCTEQLPADFDATDDEVTLGTLIPATHIPSYDGAVLSWPEKPIG